MPSSERVVAPLTAYEIVSCVTDPVGTEITV